MGNVIIDGVIVTPQKHIFNPKGDVLHGMKIGEAGYAGFGEAYFSTVSAGVIKAWKRHSKMTLNLVCPVGKIRFILFDDRVDSPTKGLFQETILSVEENYARLTVPPGVWLGFQGLSEGLNLLLNVANIKHDPDEQENITLDKSHIIFDWNK